MASIFDILEERELIEQATHENEIRELLDKEKIRFYIGFDPTADSLHVGHFVSMMIASYMQKAGHTPIILVGGGTVSIGDPSGKTDLRKMMTREQIDANAEKLKNQLSKFVSFEGENKAIMVNNADWLLNLNYIDFMRDIGQHFSVNKMLAAECYKQRLETGLTFFELGYMLMQAYDFMYLYKNHGCKMQMGGNDQWSNIIAGVDLIRKIENGSAYGLTFRLLTTKEGKKMGKTEKGALWLDPLKTSPYEFYQYWRNVVDDDIRTVLCMLTFLPMDEVNRLTNVSGEAINEAKRIAAYEITKIVHGEEAAKKAEETAKALFEGIGDLENMPTTTIENAEISILDALVLTNMVPSKSQARTLISQGGITLNNNIINDMSYILSSKDFENGYSILRKGKKTHHKLIVK